MSTDPLLAPFALKHLRLRNRIVSTSHEPAYAEDGLPKLRYQLYHEEKAKGGIGLTMIGGSANVAIDSPSAFGQLYVGDDTIVAYFRQLADRVHAHGAAVMTQLTHMGRRTGWDYDHWLPIVSASPLREPAHRSFPKEIEDADIRRIVHAFGAAARRCKDGNLDGVEISAYAGHLTDQFLSPRMNRRTDRYGGHFDNRMRFALEVLEEVRGAVGDDYIVGVRMSLDERAEGGLTRHDGIAVGQRLAESGLIDFVSVVVGAATTDAEIAGQIQPLGTPLGAFLPIVGEVVVEHGTVPNDDVYTELKAASVNDGALDLEAFSRVGPQTLVSNPHDRYRLLRIGDAVASRNIHAAVFDARRVALSV
jgi:2,4-dienoyl-CoA reductase-like NADH-dependent reductase (Old Yellow Enzyme family)